MDNFSLYQILDTAPDSGKMICTCGFDLHGGSSASLTRWMHAAICFATGHSQTALPGGMSCKTVFVPACESVWVPSLLA